MGPTLCAVLFFRSIIVINCDIEVLHNTAMFVSLIEISIAPFKSLKFTVPEAFRLVVAILPLRNITVIYNSYNPLTSVPDTRVVENFVNVRPGTIVASCWLSILFISMMHGQANIR